MEQKTYFAQDKQGNILPNAQVKIFNADTNTLAAGLVNKIGQPLGNPFNADVSAMIVFSAPDGFYDMEIADGGIAGQRIRIQFLDVNESLAKAKGYADDAKDNADLLLSGADAYPTSAAAQAAITAGTETRKYFTVKGSDAVWTERYQNVGGIATPTGEVWLSGKGVKALIEENQKIIQSIADYIKRYDHGGLIKNADDQPGFWIDDKVLLSFHKGDLDVRGITMGTMIKFEQAASRDPYHDTVLNDFEFVPLAWIGDQVFLWRGRDKQIHSSHGFAGMETPTVINSKVNSRLRAKCSAVSTGSVANLVPTVLLTGDSWTDNAEIPVALRTILQGKYGDGGTGYVSFSPSRFLPGVGLTNSGFTQGNLYSGDMSRGTGVNAQRIFTQNNTSIAKMTGLVGSRMVIYYHDLPGTFTVSVDGAPRVDVVGGNTNKFKSFIVDVAAGTHSVEITTLTNTTGNYVNIFGVKATLSSGRGINIMNMGQGGAQASNYGSVIPNLPNVASVLDPDAVFIILGTNELIKNVAVSTFKTNLMALVSAWKTAVTDSAGVNILFPAHVKRILNNYPEYAQAAMEVAISLGVGYMNGLELFPSSDVGNSLNLFADKDHLNQYGAQHYADFVVNALLEI